MKPDYTEFDNALLKQIDAGRNTLMKLEGNSSGLIELAKPFTVPRPGSPFGCKAYRVIDRRLQALRKHGKIRFNGKVWTRLNLDGTEA